MADTVNLELLGKNIRQMQADMRNIRGDISMLDKRLDIIVDRMSAFEGKIEAQLDQMTVLIDMRFDGLMAKIVERH